jgi:hypothetical protein
VPNHSAFRKRNRFGAVASHYGSFEIACVLVRRDHIASCIENANHRVMCAAEKLGVSGS